MRRTLVFLVTLASAAWAGGPRKPKDEPQPLPSLTPAATAAEAPPVRERKAPVKPKTPDQVAHELLVAFESDAAATHRDALFSKVGVVEKNKVGSTALYLVIVPPAADPKVATEALKAGPGVKYVEPNLRFRILPVKE